MRISERGRAVSLAALGGAAAIGLSAIALSCSSGGGGSGAEPTPSGTSGATPTPTPSVTSTLPGAAAIACAPNGAAAFSSNCTLEFARDGALRIAVVRHADGGFRRFVVRDDGGLEQADGAVRAAVARSGDTLEITVGADRYRLTTSQLAGAP